MKVTKWAQGSPRLAKTAFTLAEVLITLGVIGVVATMTFPTLMQNYKKHVVETRLAKFYTTINQAIQMSETVNGDKRYWDTLGGGFETDENGDPDYTKPQALAWFEKYLKPYLKYSKIDVFNNNNINGFVLVYFEDGSLLRFSGASWNFYPNPKNLNYATDDEGITVLDKSNSGIEFFTFDFIPNCTKDSCKYHQNKGVEPYTNKWDGTIYDQNGLKTHSAFGCMQEMPTNARVYCAKLIQLNGWKIPKDYPLKF